MNRRTCAINLADDWAPPIGSTIAVVGASARAAAASLVRAAYRPVAADRFGDEDLGRLCPATRVDDYPRGLVTWLRDTPCDAWLYTGALENYPELVDEMASIRPLWGNSGEVLTRVRDPILLQQALRKHDFASPETRATADGLPRDGTWLTKTYRGSSGVGVTTLGDGTGQHQYVQRFVRGEPGSAIFAGSRLQGVTRQLVGETWTGAGPFQYCGTVAPWRVPEYLGESLHRLGSVLVAEFSIAGVFGVDFVFDGATPWIVEVNPRYTAAMEIVEREKCISLFHILAGNHQVANLETHLAPQFDHWGKAILFAKLPAMVSAEFCRWALEQPDLADIPAAGTRLEPGQPVLTVFAEAGSFALILPVLKSRICELGIRLWGGAESCDWVS